MVVYSGNIPKCTEDSHVRFDEGYGSPVIKPKRGSLLYRTTLTIACLMTAMCAVGAVQKKVAPKPAPVKTSLTESELRTLAEATPDENNAGLLYSVAIATSNNVERKQEYLKVAAACLIACDKKDVYTKYVKSKLLNATEFEAELKDDCKQCSGTGTKKNRCYACKGSGQCSVCKGSGQTKTVKYGNGSFNKYYELKPCSKCKESGRCQRCDGEGTTNEKCWTCAGTGKAFSKTVATRVFHDSCNTIAESMNVHMASNNAKVDSEGMVDLEKERTGQQYVVKEGNMPNKPKNGTGKNDGQIIYVDGSVVTIPYGTITQFALRNVKNISQARMSRSARREEILKIAVPDGVVSIKPHAFGYCKNLKSVTIPDSVTNIGSHAFTDCENLTSVTMPNSVESIDSGAFKHCKNLKSVKLPSRLKDIKDSLFSGCSTLESVVIPPGVTNIGSCAFRGCPSLKSVSIPDSVEDIADWAFDETCRLEKSNKRRNAESLAVVRKAEELFTKACTVDGEFAEVKYYELSYCMIKNTMGTYNFVVASFLDNPNDYACSFMILPTPDSRNRWYAAIKECTEKIKTWGRIAAENKVKHVRKEIPIGGVQAYLNYITKGNGYHELLQKAVREPISPLAAMESVRFIGVVEALDFGNHHIAIVMTCGDSFNSVIFSGRGTIEEIDNEIVEFLTFVNPERLENARKTQAKKEDLFH